MALKLFLFNPEHDMALANFTPYYRPPREIVRMREDLSYLPLWYACSGGKVGVADRTSAGRYLDECAVRGLCPSGDWLDRMESDTEVFPWGWDPAVVRRLQEAGAGCESYPDVSALERIRYLSGRQRCVEILHRMQELSGCCGRAVECLSVTEVEKLVRTEGEVILKSPWSGSGRGLLRVSASSWNANAEGWVARVIRTQGGVMCEPLYNKVCDFAMEYLADGRGGVDWVGYSLFETDLHGNYKLNLLLPDWEIERRLSLYVTPEILRTVSFRLREILQELLGTDYAGYLGVDMMICRDGETFLVHPCVEVNLRMNMGVVARLFYDRYIAAPVSGRYVVEHYGGDGNALKRHRELSELFPARVTAEGRLSGGYWSLTPVSEATRYQAYVMLDSVR